MKSWIEAILEWVNCLEIDHTAILDVTDLQDESIFTKIIEKLAGQIPEPEQVSKFIEKEYPDFLTVHDPADNDTNNIYTASLLLLSSSQKISFHRPMCHLHNDTQILIKRFLEALLPYGKSITRDILSSTIAELSDATPRTPPQTPQDRPLRNFFTSPAAQSAHRHRILNEKTRELRLLKAELETERYEKADLQEDIKIREEKIQNLQSKLNERTQELKALRAERTRPSTPQSARKNKRLDNMEADLKREIQHLESFNSELQSQLDALESEKEELAHRLTSKVRLNLTLKEKVDAYERNLETLGIQLDQKSSELLDLRLQNEELRSHIKDMQPCSLDVEQSFEIENMSRAQSPPPGLNTSEALSSIVDIQLQEAKEESFKLKSELDGLQRRLDDAIRECEEFRKANEVLGLKAEELVVVKETLEQTEEELKKSTEHSRVLGDEKKELTRQLEYLQQAMIDKEVTLNDMEDRQKSLEMEIKNNHEILSEIEQQRKQLSSSLINCEEKLNRTVEEKELLTQDLELSREKIRDLQNSLNSEVLKCSELTISFEQNIKVSEAKIIKLEMEKMESEEKLKLKTAELDEIMKHLREKVATINSLNMKVDKIQVYQSNQEKVTKELEIKLCELNELKDELQSQVDEERRSFMKLSGENEQLQQNLTIADDERKKLLARKIELESQVSSLQEEQKRLVEALSSLESKFSESLNETEEIRNNCNEFEKKYTEAAERMSFLSSELERITGELNGVTAERDSIQSDLNDASIQTFSKISQLKAVQKTLQTELSEEQNKNQRLLSENSSLLTELSNLKTENKNLVENFSLIDSRSSEFQKKVEELQILSEELEKRNENGTARIASLESKITELTVKLNEAISERDLAQNDLINSGKQLELLEEKTRDLQKLIDDNKLTIKNLEEIQRERENSSKELINSLEERLLVAQSAYESLKIEEKIREESVEILELKLEQLTKEKLETELKMKEVILNLQEVRASQDALLETQSKALNQRIQDLDVLEKKHLEMKDNLEKELDLKRLENSELLQQSEALKDSNKTSLKLIGDLQDQLNSKQQEFEILTRNLKETEEEKLRICESLEKRKLKLLRLMKNEVTAEAAPEAEDPDIGELAKVIRELKESLRSLEQENGSLLEAVEAEKEKSEIAFKERLKSQQLSETISSMEIHQKYRENEISRLVMKKKILQELLSSVIASRDKIEENLSVLREKWKMILLEKQNVLTDSSSACDELKHLDATKSEIERLMSNINERYCRSSKPLIKVLTDSFTWAEWKIENISISNLKTEECSSIKDKDQKESSNFDVKIDLSDEQAILESELKKINDILEDLSGIEMKIDEFSMKANSYETNIKSGMVKREPSGEEKLQIQLDRLAKERKEMKDKLDAMRVRNAKMEKNMDELRLENKKLKGEVFAASIDKSEVEKCASLVEELRRENEELRRMNEELEKRPNDEEFDAKLKEIHNEYGLKLEKIKQKMKAAYNEQAVKMQNEQDRIISQKAAAMQERMELMCQKHSEDIKKYKAHVAELSSKYWDVGEKLLTEKQERENAMQRLREHQQLIATQNQMRSASLDRGFDHNQSNISSKSGFKAIQVIEEKPTRRHSVKSIQAMGNAFKAEDEDEIFDNVYLADLKEGQFRSIEPGADFDRLSELRMRNSLCRPHLKSSYAVETHLHPHALTEEDIKSGPHHEDIFNDSLSQSLLPGQKAKKRDRTQTSYKRPGPPTPSKNGGRLSLQGNELKSPNSRILREKNSDRRTTATPKRLKDFFGTSLSKRQDENAPSTPKGRRLSSIFRKPKTERG